MNTYRGKHVSSQPWPIASGASGRGRHQMKNRRRRRIVLIVIIILLVFLVYPFLEARIWRTERVVRRAEDLPADANHLNVVFLSDIHYGFWFSNTDINNLVNTVNSLKPDIVLFGGGYGTDNRTAVRFFQNLSNIHARYAVYGVIGDTDRGETDYELEHLTDTMRKAGVIPLINETVPVRMGSSTIYIAGVDDAVQGKPDLAAVSSRVSSSDYVILLSHSPAVLPNAHLATDASGRIGWFDLGLFGHTHGGQIRLFNNIFGFGDDVPDRYLSGWLTENRADLLISNGVGTSKIPIRFLCPPQIHLIELTVN